jgi:hypothetical protein
LVGKLIIIGFPVVLGNTALHLSVMLGRKGNYLDFTVWIFGSDD